jgi:uridine kinase
VTSDALSEIRGDIIAISGPSGSGKSRLASGVPRVLHLELDRFYRSHSDISQESAGAVDWEDIRSYRYDDAVEQLTRLALGTRATLPVYDLVNDSVVGEESVETGGKIVVAEGIFAAPIAHDLNARGVPIASICLTGSRMAHVCMRVWRDVSEGRLPVHAAFRRSLRVMLHERAYIATAVKLGATPMSRKEARDWLHAAVVQPSGLHDQ